MIKRGIFYLVFFIAILPFSSANFACGEINHSDVNPSWFNVKVYYPDYPNNHSICKANPDNKYCCDPTQILSPSWKIGKIISAELNESGWVSNTVYSNISGAGYDLFETINPEKIVSLSNIDKIYIKKSNLLANISSAQRYNDSISYTLINHETNTSFSNFLCYNCTSAVLNITTIPFGKNELSITVSNGISNYTESIVFYNLKKISLSRTIICEDCFGNKIKLGDNVTIILNLSASHNFSGTFNEIFPNDWKLLDGGNITEMTQTHKIISWEISGKEVILSYRLAPPKNYMTYRYSFQGQLGSYLFNEERIILYKYPFLKGFGVPKEYSKNKILGEKSIYNPKISPNEPAVIELNHSSLSQIAIFPKEEEFEVFSFIITSSDFKMERSYRDFIVWSSLENEEIDKIFIRFKIQKSSAYDEAELYFYEEINSTWNKIEIEMEDEDEWQVHYKTFTQEPGIYSIKRI